MEEDWRCIQRTFRGLRKDLARIFEGMGAASRTTLDELSVELSTSPTRRSVDVSIQWLEEAKHGLVATALGLRPHELFFQGDNDVLERFRQSASPELERAKRILAALRQANEVLRQALPVCPDTRAALYSNREVDQFDFHNVRISFSAIAIMGHFTCPNCGNRIEVTPDNRNGYGWYGCDWKHDPVWFVADLWNVPATWDRTVHRVESTRENFERLKQLLVVAKQHESSFITPDKRRFLRGIERLYVYSENGRIVGYSLWNNLGRDPCLRQVFVLPTQRRQGIASRLIEVEAREARLFVVETPNEGSMAVLKRLRYVTRTEKGYGGPKVRFTQGA